MRIPRVLIAGAGLLALAGVARRRSFELTGKVVVITGGSRGLGLLMARRFGAEGARLALCARDEGELRRAEAELSARGYNTLALRCDVSDPVQVRRFIHEVVRRFGRIDVLVNNAGVIHVGPVETMGRAELHQALDAIFWGMVNMTFAALPLLRQQHTSRLVNITSIGGAVAVPHLLPYSAAKFATVGFSTGLRSELIKDGVHVVTVLPWLMRTGSFGQALVKGQREREATLFTLGGSLPLVSLNAERAADRIVKACLRGEPFVTIGAPARVAQLAMGVMPNTTLRLLSAVARALPGAPQEAMRQRGEPAERFREGVAASFLTAMGDRAAEANNERPTTLH